MNSSLIAATILLLGVAGQAFADGACPLKAVTESAKTYREHTHNYCEANWKAVLGTPAAAGQTHDGFINACARDCYKDLGSETAGNALGAVSGLAAIGVASYVGSQTIANGGNPASP